jgi:rod shape determining protein RodA
MLSKFLRQDWFLLGSFSVLAAFSLIELRSAAPELFWVQFAWFVAGGIAIEAMFLYDFRPIINYRWIIFGFYLAITLLLLSTLFIAPVIRESQSWLAIGPLRFQPSELSKVALIILLAYFFGRRHIAIAHVRNLFVSFVYVALPAGIILLQPDWGSATVLGFIWVGFLLVSGIRWRHLAIGCVFIIVLGFASWHFFLADYQKERIIGFLNPAYDPLGINYSTIQAKIAIGSGGIFGKGFRQGTQTQLGFLTEPGTDFIFAAIVEEWGLIGGGALLGAFFFLVVRIVLIGLRSRDPFSQFICLGTAILFLAEFILNMGSNLGLLPVVGVTFPFVSYGGSSLLTKAMLVGMVQSIGKHARF